MHARIKKILQELMAAEAPLTSKYLADITGVSSRTIQDDMKALQYHIASHGAEIMSVKGKGYKISVKDEAKFKAYLQEMLQSSDVKDEELPDRPEERSAYLIRRLLLSSEYLKLDELAEEMHISKSTIQNDLKTVKQVLEKYDLTLNNKSHLGLKVFGSEMKLRYCMSEYLFDRQEEVYVSTDYAYLSALKLEGMDHIWNIIVDQLKENNITLSDIALNNLFIHVTIAYKRISHGNSVAMGSQQVEEVKYTKEYVVAARIVRQLEEMLEVSFPYEEIAYIAIHLLGTKMINNKGLNRATLERVMDEDVYDLTYSIVKKIDEELHLGIIHDDTLLLEMGLHLKPAINRFKYNMNLRNPMLEDIRQNYPLAFEAGVLAGVEIENQLGFIIDENEVGYLALHIGAAMERLKLKSTPKKCLIVCASGVGSSQLLYYKLKSRFRDKLDIVGTTQYYKLSQMPLDDIDFIVSTIPMPNELPVPVIEVKAIVGDRDMKEIESFVADKHMLDELLTEEHIYLGESFDSMEEVLAFFAHTLEEEGLVDHTFLQSMHEREEIAPTSFGNLMALPHPITPHSSQTFLSIMTLTKSIVWKDKPVQLVCLISVAKGSQEDLQSLYSLLGKVIDTPAIVQQLLKIKNPKEFVNAMKGVES